MGRVGLLRAFEFGFVQVRDMDLVSCLPCGYSVSEASFVKEAVLFLMYIFDTFGCSFMFISPCSILFSVSVLGQYCTFLSLRLSSIL